MRRRWNILVWSGFGIALLAFSSYIPLFVLFPVTRDVPWVNYLLFFVAFLFLALGLKRAFREPERYRGKVSGTILAALSLLMAGVFCFIIFYAAKRIPASSEALHTGQPAADFTLSNADGKQVGLPDLLKSNRAVLLIFYRGYW